MMREDYLMRAIGYLARELGRIIAMLAGLEVSGRAGDALQAVQHETARLTGVDPEMLDALSVEQTLGLLRPFVQVQPARAECLAVLLEKRSQFLATEGDAAAASRVRAKALALLVEIRGVHGGFAFPEARAAFEALSPHTEAV